MLILFLNFCNELRDLCRFTKVPDAPLLIRFKQDFLPFIEDMFVKLVDFTKPICKAAYSSLSDMLAFDMSRFELYVAKNDPKSLNTLIRKLKAYYKDKTEIDPYKMAYRLMPSKAAQIKSDTILMDTLPVQKTLHCMWNISDSVMKRNGLTVTNVDVLKCMYPKGNGYVNTKIHTIVQKMQNHLSF